MYITPKRIADIYNSCPPQWLTPWYPARENPRRNGLYLVRWSKFSLLEFCTFRDGVWYAYTMLHEFAVMKKDISSMAWCGLTWEGRRDFEPLRD